MKRLLMKLIPAVLLFCLMGGTTFAQNKIATVDLGRVFTNYWKFKQASAAIDNLKADMAKTDKDLVDTWQKAKENYTKLLGDANNQVLSQEERDKNKKAAEDKLKEVKDDEAGIQQFEQQARTRLSEQTMRMRDNLLTEIRAAITSKGKAGSYTYIFDAAAQTADHTPVLLYSNGDDITDAVLAQLNASAPVDTTTDTKQGGKK
jgi:outer membrane protein